MFKQIIVHLGLHKTGTTSIQRTLLANHEILLKNGVGYPKFKVQAFFPANHSWPIVNLVSDNPISYHLNIKEGLRQDEISQSNRHNLKHLKALSLKAEVLIISAEGISNLLLPSLYNLRSLIESVAEKKPSIEFHYFQRNAEGYLTSVVQERLKGGTLEEVIFKGLEKSKLSNEYLHFNLLQEVFPNSRIEKHSFEEACSHSSGLEGYFFEHILKYTSTFKEIKLSNESLSSLAYELIHNYITNSSEYKKIPLKGTAYLDNLTHLSAINGSKFKLHARHKKYLEKIISNTHSNEVKNIAKQLKAATKPSDCWQNFDSEEVYNCISKTSNECKNICVDYLRDVGVSFEKSNVNVALKLMTLAMRLRPNGPFIAKKVQQYQLEVDYDKSS